MKWTKTSPRLSLYKKNVILGRSNTLKFNIFSSDAKVKYRKSQIQDLLNMQWGECVNANAAADWTVFAHINNNNKFKNSMKLENYKIMKLSKGQVTNWVKDGLDFELQTASLKRFVEPISQNNVSSLDSSFDLVIDLMGKFPKRIKSNNWKHLQFFNFLLMF